MELRDYVQERIGVLTEAIIIMHRSERGTEVQSAKVTFCRLREQMELARDELRYVLYYADTGTTHPDVTSEWVPKPVGH